MVTSQNGWKANDPSLIQPYTVGQGRVVRLRKGDAGFLLKHYADWHDAHIEDVDQGADDWGYAERMIRGSETTVSNHASGTAIDLNATKHPLGVRGTFSAAKAKAIRERLKLYGGVIRWGGDYKIRADEMHFEINADAATVKRIADTIRAARKAEAVRDPNAAPAAHTHLVEQFNLHNSISLADVSAVEKARRQPWHDAAYRLHVAINKAWDAYEDATKENR